MPRGPGRGPRAGIAVGIAVVVVTAAFGTSANLANAYGMSVTMTMLITSVLTAVVNVRWCLKAGRPALLPPLLLLLGGLLTLDALMAASCSLKFLQGAWLPVAIALLHFSAMATWARGSALLRAAVRADQPPLAPFVAWLAAEPIQRVPRVAVYAVAESDVVPPALLLNLQHNQVRRGSRGARAGRGAGGREGDRGRRWAGCWGGGGGHRWCTRRR